MRKIWIQVVVTLLALALCCCSQQKKYELRQPMEAISTINILNGMDYEPNTQTNPQLAELQISDGLELVEQVLKLECKRAIHDPPGDFGKYIIEIIYADGEKEMLGPDNCGWIQENGKLRFNNWSFDDTFVDLVLECLENHGDSSVVPSRENEIDSN